MSFWKELSRRNVIKVGIAYAVAAWLIIHPVDIIFPILHLPEWSITLIAAFLIICFPFVLLFAWIYEVTPEGLKKTKEVPLSNSITQITSRRLNYLLVGLLIVAVGLIIFDKFYLDQRVSENEQAKNNKETKKTKKSIAVLPFTNISTDKEQESFVDGLSEELINSITQFSDLRVIARTSSFAFKDSDKTAQEIAKALNVEYILEGSVRKAADDLRITAQLINAADESHLWSKTYDKKLKDIFAIQEDIATTIAGELKATLGIGRSLKQVGGTDNIEAYESYLAAKGQFGNNDLAVISQNIKVIDGAITKDPKFALAWALKSKIHCVYAVMGPIGNATAEQNEALKAAQRALEIEPNLPEGYESLGVIKKSRDFIEAETAFHKSTELTNELLGSVDIVPYYQSVGYFKKAQEILEMQRLNDPLNQSVHAYYMLNSTFFHQTRQAEEEYKRIETLFSERWEISNFIITATRFGSKEGLSRKQIIYSTPIFDKVIEYLESTKDGLAVLHRIYTDEHNLSQSDLIDISVLAAYFGDPEFSMDAMEKGLKIDLGGIMWAWLPVMKEVRQMPRFNELVKKIGLVDYWNKFGWPDICHQLDNGDFECD